MKPQAFETLNPETAADLGTLLSWIEAALANAMNPARCKEAFRMTNAEFRMLDFDHKVRAMQALDVHMARCRANVAKHLGHRPDTADVRPGPVADGTAPIFPGAAAPPPADIEEAAQ